MDDIDAAPLPWPVAWPAPKGLGGLGWTLCGSVAVVTAVAVGVSLVLPVPAQSRLTVLIALVLPAVGLVLSYPASRSKVRTRPVGRVHTTGTGELSVPFLPELWAGIWVVVVGCVLILAMLVHASWQVGLGRPPDPAATMIGVVLLAMAVPFAGLVVEGLRGTASRGELLLSPEGIRYRTFAYDASLDWVAVQRISVTGGDGLQIVVLAPSPRLHRHSWLLRAGRTVRAQAADGKLVIRCLWLSVDPALALHSLRYYHAHPEARAELGTDAAVHRVRRRAVLTA